MIYEDHRLAIPSNTEYSIDQMRMMMAEVEAILGRAVTAAEWSRLWSSQPQRPQTKGVY
jgi:hypothetical protein